MSRSLRGVTRLLEQFPWAGEEPRLHRAGRCTVVVLGAGGDLTSRKLVPALFHLAQHGLLHPGTRVIGVARNAMDDAGFRRAMRHAVRHSDEVSGFRERDWRAFAARLQYVAGDLGDPATYAALRDRIEAAERGARDGEGGRLFYFALPPQVFPTAVAHLRASEAAPRIVDPARRPWARVIV